jgi:enoyl-CoA hydratase/carnithine racemase
VVEDHRVVDAAVDLARVIADNAPLSVTKTKALIRQADESSLSNGLRNEREALLTVFQSADRVEGMNAFAEKRKPSWTGR